MRALLLTSFQLVLLRLHRKGDRTDLREIGVMNSVIISNTGMMFKESFPSALPSHCMPASCKSNRIGLVEPRTRESC